MKIKKKKKKTSTCSVESIRNKENVESFINSLKDYKEENNDNLASKLLNLISKDFQWVSESETYAVPIFGKYENGNIKGALDAFSKTFDFKDIKLLSIIADEEAVITILQLQYKTKTLGKFGTTKTAQYWSFDNEGKISTIKMFIDTALISNDYLGGAAPYSNEVLVTKAIIAINERDWKSLENCFEPDARIYGFGPTELNRDGYIAQLKEFTKSFPDFKLHVESIIANGHEVSLRETIYGTHEGVYQGIKPTNKQISFKSTNNGEIRNGKFVTTYVVADFVGLLTQLGAIPPQATKT